MDTFLFYQVFSDIVANITFGLVVTALILMFYGDIKTTVTPSQAASGLMIYALCLAVYQMIRSSILTHTGSWFVRRAKYAISKMAEFESKEEEAEIMSHLVTTRNLFITSWTKSSSNFVTEIVAVCLISAFNWKLFSIASGLFIFGKILSSMDDMYLIREQHKLYEITKEQSSASANKNESTVEVSTSALVAKSSI